MGLEGCRGTVVGIGRGRIWRTERGKGGMLTGDIRAGDENTVSVYVQTMKARGRTNEACELE